jgi:hypothetical protein
MEQTMRALSIFLVTTALLTTAGTALAAGPNDPLQVSAEQIEQLPGIYKLSDGRRAELIALNHRLFISIAHGKQKQLVVAGPNRFASRDGSISIQFGPELDTDHIVLAHNRSIAPQDAIRLASNDRAGRGSAN